jgi:hypothetical protein
MPDFFSDYFNEKLMNFQQTAETFGLDELPRTVTRSLAVETSTDSLVPISKQKISRSRLMELNSLPVVSLPTIGYSSKTLSIDSYLVVKVPNMLSPLCTLKKKCSCSMA